MAAKVPTLVIVGRPNVGKSTFFNRLAGERIAVVEDTPGVTRDRLYAEIEHKGRRFRIVDTGGILFGDDDPLIEQIRVQAEVAMAEADVVLFMVDSDEGLNPADWDLANRLRGMTCPVYVVATKADNTDRATQASEFYSLGFQEVFAVSGIHGRGVGDLLDHIADGFPISPEDAGPEEELRLAIVGRPNVGKSSLLNAFSGEQRAIVSDIPGTTRDAIDSLVQWRGRPIRLIDTAGIRRRGKIQGSIEYYMVLRASQAMQRADCAVLVLDGQEGLTDGDKRVAKVSHELGKPLVVVANKWDLVEPPDGELGRSTPAKKEFARQFKAEVPEVAYAPLRFTSALVETGLDGVVKAAQAAVDNSTFRVGTGVLNRLIEEATFEKPLTRKGKALRIYYSTQAQTRPPTFVLFCNDPELAHFSYVRFIENRIRKAFPLEGTPIRVVPRASRDRERS